MTSKLLSRGLIGTCLFLLAAAAGAQEDIPLADGDSWMASSTVEKTAWISGANDMLVVEYITQQKSDTPPTEEQSSVPGYWDGLDDETINGLIETIDSFYENNPDSMDTPVMVVIWNTYVEPEE